METIEKILEIYDQFSSDFYDYQGFAGKKDVDFYLDYAKNTDGEILDIGCGTGRVLIPIAQSDKKITGLDKSEHMLAACRNKINKEPIATQNNIVLKNADMTNFKFENKFSLVIIPFGPFNCLLTTQMQINCLKCIHNHLEDNGLLVFDVWYPDNNLLIKCDEGAYHAVKDRPYSILPDNRKVQWGLTFNSVDYNQQILHEELYFNVEYPNGQKEKLKYPSSMRYFYRFEIEHLLSNTGFEIKNLFCDFNKHEFGSKYPSELIIEASKK